MSHNMRNAFALLADTVSILQQQPRILVVLVKSRSGEYKWCLPGGIIDPGETPADAAWREVLEETGRDIGKDTLHNKSPYISNSADTCFFCIEVAFNSMGHDERVATFHGRRAFQRKVETHDYGFARKEGDDIRGYRWVVRDYGGKKKEQQTLSDGTYEGLELAFKHEWNKK